MICFPSFTGMFERALPWPPTVVTTCFWLLVTRQLHGWSRLWSLSATFEQNLTGLCYLPEQCWHLTKALPLALSNHRSIFSNWQGFQGSGDIFTVWFWQHFAWQWQALVRFWQIILFWQAASHPPSPTSPISWQPSADKCRGKHVNVPTDIEMASFID